MTTRAHRLTRQLALSLLLPLAGCYGAAPPRPTPVALPPRVLGTPIVVQTRSTIEIENVPREYTSCPAGHSERSPACSVTRTTVREPVQRTLSTARYGAAPLNLAQFKVLTDPQYDQKLQLLADHSRVCVQANVPRWVGIALSAAGAVAIGIGAAYRVPALTYSGIGAAGGGVGSYGLGYFAFGGNRCSQAADLHRQLELSRDIAVTRVSGGAEATEMRTRADQFNARQGVSARAADDPQELTP